MRETVPSSSHSKDTWRVPLGRLGECRHHARRGRTRVSFLPFVWDASKREQGAGGGLDRVEREAEAIVEAVQRRMRSRLYDRGRYSPTREAGVHHFHRLLAEFSSAR